MNGEPAFIFNKGAVSDVSQLEQVALKHCQRRVDISWRVPSSLRKPWEEAGMWLALFVPQQELFWSFVNGATAVIYRAPSLQNSVLWAFFVHSPRVQLELCLERVVRGEVGLKAGQH